MDHNVKLFKIETPKKITKAHKVMHSFGLIQIDCQGYLIIRHVQLPKGCYLGNTVVRGYHLSRNSLNCHTQPVRLIPNSKQDIKSGQSLLLLHCFLVPRQGNSKHKSKNITVNRYRLHFHLYQQCELVV